MKRPLSLFAIVIFCFPAIPAFCQDIDLAEKVVFIDRKSQIYRASFAARPDAERFQIQRLPSAKWPRKDNFYLAIGETSADKQIRLESFLEKQARNENGEIVDASELEITWLPTGKKHQLVRNVPVDIPTYYAEMKSQLDPGKSFYIKEGDTFVLPGDPNTKYRLTKVDESSVTVSYTDASGKEKILAIQKK